MPISETHTLQAESTRAIIRILLAKKGWRYAQLAEAIGMPYTSTVDLCLGRRCGLRGRYRIEKALGSTIWTPSALWDAYRRAAESLGFEVPLASREQLREAAARLGIDAASFKGKLAAIAEEIGKKFLQPTKHPESCPS